jgi:UDP-N-acetylmuramate dehydrogenase
VSVASAQAALSAYTTLRLGGPAARLTEAATEEQLVTAIRAADQAGEPVLVLGGGSNLVVADEGFPGTVIRVATRSITTSSNGAADGQGGTVTVQVAAGEPWDRLVEWSVAEGLTGLECLSGIPGLAGATPIQNVGAYGQEVAQTITVVRAYDRERGEIVTLTRAQCAFGYRTSMLKRDAIAAGAATGRHVVLEVTFALRRVAGTGQPLSAPVRYPQLAGALGVAAGDRVPLEQARLAVLDLRRSKGMVLDPADPDTRSAGSFFTNPVLTAAQFGELRQLVAARAPGAEVPHFSGGDAVPGGAVKVSAAWLIEQAGFARGYPAGGAARISTKHTLALTNPGGASTAALLALAREITAGVRAAFGVDLVNEPTLVGVSL